MRQINWQRQFRLFYLAQFLDEIVTKRHDLLRQLEDLVTQQKSIQLEHAVLHLDVQTSDLPDEILALIFEAGVTPYEPRFGELISHVSQRWRRIALATPWLWANIRMHRIKITVPCFSGGNSEPFFSWIECNGWKEMATAYFSRCKSLPIKIHIRGLIKQDFTPIILRSIGDHIGHCYQLFLEHVPREILPKLLKFFKHQPVPILRSFALTLELNTNLNEDPFPLEPPLLTTGQVGNIQPRFLQYLVPAFASVTSLRYTDITVTDREAYDFLHRDGLDFEMLAEKFPTI
ncbi:hypothetical protein HWV62_26478 [Athelia sp. TMB]|nr:hypothetical protein HWV62_26478 [Athelia sp. TMB]